MQKVWTLLPFSGCIQWLGLSWFLGILARSSWEYAQQTRPLHLDSGDLTLAMGMFKIGRYNRKTESTFKAQSLQTSLSHSEHRFGVINALVTTFTKSDLWLPNSWHNYQIEKSRADSLNTEDKNHPEDKSHQVWDAEILYSKTSC